MKTLVTAALAALTLAACTPATAPRPRDAADSSPAEMAAPVSEPTAPELPREWRWEPQTVSFDGMVRSR